MLITCDTMIQNDIDEILCDQPISRYVEYICPPKNIDISFVLFDYISSNVSESERLSKKRFFRGKA